jgi:two-component system, LytTR family, sensor kinase
MGRVTRDGCHAPQMDIQASRERTAVNSPILIVLGCVLLLALMQTAAGQLIRVGNPAARENPRTWLTTFSLTAPSWLAIAMATPLVLATARRFPFDAPRLRVSIGVHSLIALGLSLFQLTVMSATYLAFWHPASGRFAGVFGTAFRNLFLLDLVAYWAILGGYLVTRHSTLQVDLAEAKLAAMRSQLNPHFLFNSLHAVSTLAMKGELSAVVETLGRLSDLLRVAIDDRQHEVPIAEELKFLDNYLMIQDVRFADRLHVVRTVAPDALDALVPPMILQPLVENAIEHGLQGKVGGLKLEIVVGRQDAALTMEVHDDGPGFPASGTVERIGLANTRGRLEHLYGSSCRFSWGNSPQGGAVVRISLPFRLARAIA